MINGKILPNLQINLSSISRTRAETRARGAGTLTCGYRLAHKSSYGSAKRVQLRKSNAGIVYCLLNLLFWFSFSDQNIHSTKKLPLSIYYELSLTFSRLVEWARAKITRRPERHVSSCEVLFARVRGLLLKK